MFQFFSKRSNNFHYTTKTFKFLSTLLHVVVSSSFSLFDMLWRLFVSSGVCYINLLLTDSLSYSHKYKQHNGGD